MTLNSFKCMLFFAAVLGGLRLMRLLFGRRPCFAALRKYWLLLASYVFLTAADWRFSLCLLALSLVTWACALRIPGGGGKGWLTAGAGFALGLLAVFKYLDFFIGSFCALLGISGPTLGLIVPLGVSFYSFSAVGYLVDVYRGKLAPERDFAALALYLAFFPKLVSGPLVRADSFLAQLKNGEGPGREDFRLGLQLIARGFFRKMVLADNLGVFVDSIYAAPAAYTGATVFLAAFIYPTQLYFDFAGYSDIAIGMARMLGFRFERNFDLPFLSANPTEFWKRWHISLSAWLRDYLYFPLGGNRRGERRTELNLMLTMLLGGLWHGASWCFVLWGGLQGLGLVAHKRFSRARLASGREAGVLWRLVSPLLNYLYTAFSWIFFRSETIGKAFEVIRCLFRGGQGLSQPESWAFLGMAVVLGEIVFALRRSRRCGGRPAELDAIFDFDRVLPTALFLTFVGITFMMAYYGNTAFIYGNF